MEIKKQSLLKFDVDEYIVVDGVKVKSNGYDLLGVYLTLYLEDIGYFVMQHPNVKNDGEHEQKSVSADSIDSEWVKTRWVGLEINTGGDGSLEQLVDGNLNELGFAKEFVVFYRPDKPELSLLHLLLKKMDGWSVSDADIDASLWNKRMRIETQTVNLYNLLVGIVAPKIECIIVFDILNLKIKAIAKSNLDSSTYDTNIFISHRNLAENINVKVNDDSVFTKLNCQGDGNLNFKEVNYNDAYIVNYSYFMCEPYMNTALVNKITAWQNWRDDNRQAFSDLSKSRADLNDKIYEIEYRVPDDGLDWNQWDEMDGDLLQENLRYYNALLTSLQVSVDDDPQYDADGNYIPWETSGGEVDHQAYLDLLWDQANGYGGYYTYFDVMTYIIPNIEIAISNLGLPEEDKHDYIKDYETDWEIYGIEELKGKEKNYVNQLDALSAYSKAWSDMTDEEKAIYLGDEDMYNVNGRTQYITISGYLGDAQTEGTLRYVLSGLEEQKSLLENDLEDIDTERTSYINTAKITASDWGFTEAELQTIAHLTFETDYTNANIITTSLDTTVTRIDREQELYDLSLEKLSEICQPQFNFTVDMDNLLDIETFKGWRNDFKLLNFFRLGIRDNYSVKLRMIKYVYNPCERGENLKISFSNFVTSRSGRSDLTGLIKSSGGGNVSQGAITYGTGNSSDELEYMTSLLEAMTKTNLFKNSVSNIASNVTIDEATLSSLIADRINSSAINVSHIYGDEAQFQTMFSNYIDSEWITTKVINADDAQIGNLVAEIVRVGGTTIANNTVTTENVVASLVSGQQGDFDNLTASTAFVQGLLSADNLQANIANISTLTADSAFVRYLQGLSSQVITSTVDTQFVKNLVVESVAVSDLLAGDIVLSGTMRIISNNPDGGNVAFDGSTLQFMNGDGDVGIQIGYGNTSDFPHIVIKDENGSSLFTSEGITSNAVPNGLIVNNMISDSTIDEGKLSFSVVHSNSHGGVDITQIWNGEDGNWGTEMTSFKNTATADIQTLKDKIEVVIETPNGKNIRGGSITLSAKVYQNSVDITDTLNASCFVWTRQSLDSADDTLWNEDWVENNPNGSKTLTLTSSDLSIEADFKCTVTTAD